MSSAPTPGSELRATTRMAHRLRPNAQSRARFDLQIGAVSRKHVRGGVEVLLRVVDRGRGFAERGGGAFELPGVRRHVAGGEDAFAARAHRAVDLDRPALDVDAPVLYRTQRVA